MERGSSSKLLDFASAKHFGNFDQNRLLAPTCKRERDENVKGKQKKVKISKLDIDRGLVQ